MLRQSFAKLWVVSLVFAVVAGLNEARADGPIVSRANPAKVLDADRSDAGYNGCRVQLWDFRDQSQQRWRIVSVGNGYVKIVCLASGLVLDADRSDVGLNGCRVQLWQDRNQGQQHWRPIPVGGGYVKLVNRASGLVLDADSSDVHLNGCRIQLWQYRASANQHWRLR